MSTATRAVPALFLMIILLVSAPTASTQHTVLTDADRKEILSVLFEHELAAAQNGKEAIIRMSPGTHASWLLELPGIRFQHMAYSEMKEVSEYYDLRDVKIRRNFLELWFSKGNFCKRGGAVYEFRKENGKWKAKTPKYIESHAGSGTACVGCKTGSGLVYGLRQKRAQAARINAPKRQDLLLTGKAHVVRCRRDDTRYIRCNVDLSLDFSNRSNQPIIMLKPNEDYRFWFRTGSLALTKADSEAYDYVYSMGAWPSFTHSEEYRQLAHALDQATPPAQLTRTIAPGESWTWNTTVDVAVSEENTCSDRVGVEIGWKEIKKQTAPLWLRVSYEMWPLNVDNRVKDPAERLRERWKQYGILYLVEKTDGVWDAHLTSEPIELDFRAVELN